MHIENNERKTSDIIISDEFRNILEIFKDKSIVAELLLHKRLDKSILVDDHVNFISISHGDMGKISYLTLDRIRKISQSSDDDFWTTSKRFRSKPGAFVSKILKDIDQVEIEKFSTLYKTFTSDIDFNFKVVNGNDIRKFYSYQSHLKQEGTLGQSCMKHDQCQDFFNLYTDNSDIVSMLTMTSFDDKLIGRALLWEFDGNKIMDRVYTINDEKYSNHFFKWAKDNGYLYKAYQNWKNSMQFTDGREFFEKEISINIPIYNYKKYPYLDTFKWLDMTNGSLSNFKPKHFSQHNSDHRVLGVACGGYENASIFELDHISREYCHRGDMAYLEYMDIWTSTNNCHYSETNEAWILNDDSIYSNELEDYIYKDDEKNKKDRIEDRLEFVKKSRRTSSEFEKFIHQDYYQEGYRQQYTLGGSSRRMRTTSVTLDGLVAIENPPITSEEIQESITQTQISDSMLSILYSIPVDDQDSR